MDVMLIIFLFAFGACVGSFLNVLIYRLPREQSIVFPPSHCPRCGEPIKWYDNIPIVSWLLLRGRCRSCGGRISPRYILIELLTGLLVAGLYVCYFVLHARRELGALGRDWPVFTAHVVLLCGLLACSAVDIELFIVPLPVMWFCAAVGIAAAAYRPHPIMPTVPVPLSAAALGAAIGLIIAKVLLHYGYIQESFLDAEDRPSPVEPVEPVEEAGRAGQPEPVGTGLKVLRELLYIVPAGGLGVLTYLALRRWEAFGLAMRGHFPPVLFADLADRVVVICSLAAAVVAATLWTRLARAALTAVVGARALGGGEAGQHPVGVAMTPQHGVSPRVEILRELLFLTPAIVLGLAGYFLAARVGAIRRAMSWALDPAIGGALAGHVGSAMGAVFGLLVGLGLIWGIRILGTLAFDKEAMGLGDVHILAAVGAVAGWQAAVLTFFTAPLFGVIYVLHCAAAGRGRREIPYGPWLAVGAAFVLVFHDRIVAFILPGG